MLSVFFLKSNSITMGKIIKQSQNSNREISRMGKRGSPQNRFRETIKIIMNKYRFRPSLLSSFISSTSSDGRLSKTAINKIKTMTAISGPNCRPKVTHSCSCKKSSTIKFTRTAGNKNLKVKSSNLRTLKSPSETGLTFHYPHH